MHWQISHRADAEANALAKQHYTCQSPDSDQFMPPGSCVVLKWSPRRALWGTSYPMGQFVKHAWPDAWVCSIFHDARSRQDKHPLPSELILEAVAATRWMYGEPPDRGMITFVNPAFVPPIIRRGTPIYGYCFLKAGFTHVGYTQGGLWAWQLFPDQMPAPVMPIGAQYELEAC